MDEPELKARIAAIANRHTTEILAKFANRFPIAWQTAEAAARAEMYQAVHHEVAEAVTGAVAAVSEHLTTAYTEATDGE